MAIPKYLATAVLFGIISSPLVGQGRRIFNGSVENIDDQPVRNEIIEIRMGGTYRTSDRGEFTFRGSDNVDVNSEVIFHVHNWVVVKPCELQNGRMYLPVPSRPIDILVVKPTDERLMKIAAAELWMRCTVEEAVSQFNKSLSRQDQQSTQTTERDQAEFLSAEAAYFGLGKDTLKELLSNWIKMPKKTTYDQGLSELYMGQFTKARDLLQTAVASPDGQTESKRLVPLARTKYELADMAGAKDDLGKFLVDHPNDTIATKALEVVLTTPKVKMPSGLTATVR